MDDHLTYAVDCSEKSAFDASHRKLPCRLAWVLIDKPCLVLGSGGESLSVSNFGSIAPVIREKQSALPTHVKLTAVPTGLVLFALLARWKSRVTSVLHQASL